MISEENLAEDSSGCFTEPEKFPKVSHSQMNDFQKCQRRFYYAHILKLQPLELPVAITKGIGGHAIMEGMFEALKAGLSYEDAVMQVTDSVVLDMTQTNQPGLDVYRHVLAFVSWFQRQDLEPVEIEEKFEVEFYGFTFAYTPDLIYRYKSGPRRGQLGMFDFKFTGQYWTQKELDLYQQVPKYIEMYNKTHDVKISVGAVVQLNTRASNKATGDDLFRISYLDLNKNKMAVIVKQTERLGLEIADAKTNWEPDEFVRVGDPYGCKMCWFGDDICAQDLSGINSKKTQEMFYQHNDYFDKYEDEND
jgi:hypothetical protein